MTLLKLLKILFIALPEIVRLIRALDAHYDEAALNQKIKQDLGAISDAFEKKDGAALRNIFNS